MTKRSPQILLQLNESQMHLEACLRLTSTKLIYKFLRKQ